MNVKWGSLDRSMIVSKRSMYVFCKRLLFNYCSDIRDTQSIYYRTTSSLDRYQSNIHEDVWYGG